MKLDVKELISKLVGVLPFSVMEWSQYITVGVGASTTQVTISVPAGSTILGAIVTQTFNGAWVHTALYWTGTVWQLDHYNHYPSAISGTTKALILYRL